MAFNIGIDVGGTNVRVGVFNDITFVKEIRFKADFSQICQHNPPAIAWQQILRFIAEAIQSVINQYPTVAAIGIGFPGFIDPTSHLIAQSPNLPGLKNVDLATDLSRLMNKKVIVENDALAAAYGEYCLMQAPAESLIYVGLGTGVGGGLIYAGKPFLGYHGVAMEIGHIIIEPNGRPCGCGNLGCMEQYASASGIKISYKLATQQDLSVHDIAALARTGDAAALQAFKLAATHLAAALATVLKIVDVPNIVIGGGVSHAWDLMQYTFEAKLNADLITVLRGKIKVKISSANDQAGMLGAAMLGAT